jgi:WD40 repeat protein
MTEEQAAALRSFQPFPGLRSFTSDEARIFFGRDGMSADVARRLVRSRFVAVLGPSGSGKSSLVRAGLLPTLFAGYAASVGSAWKIVDFRPGSDPMGHLADALNRSEISKSLDAATLRTSSGALIETIAQACEAGKLTDETNVLLLVDQFEELFRYKAHPESPTADRDEKARFVALLLAATQARAQRIFVVLTLRAEFLGDCAQFRDLPEAINDSQYLVPRLTRLQRRAAIEGPIRAAGAAIEPNLVQRLLNELGEDPDQLPLLQNALMRIWEEWLRQGNLDSKIQFDHYAAIGATVDKKAKEREKQAQPADAEDTKKKEPTLQGALDRHGDEALDRANQAVGEDLVKRIFQRLRIRDDRGRETRTPASVDELCKATDGEIGSVMKAIDFFRDDNICVTFLRPFKSELDKLTPDTEIDVTHESLFRCWGKLKDEWAPEEEESRRIYVDLARRAEEKGAAENPLRGSLLTRDLEWWNKKRPNAAWAGRYHSGFGKAEKYLLDSRDRARGGVALRRIFIAAALIALAGSLGEIYSFAKIKAAREETLVHLLASRAALAASEDGAGLKAGMLLAAESLKRQPTSEAQTVVFNAAARLPPTLPDPFRSAVRQVAFGNEEKLLAGLGSDGVLQVLDAATRVPLKTVEPLRGISSFALAQHASLMVTSEGGIVAIRDAVTGKRLAGFPCSGPIQAVAMGASGVVAAALCAGQLHSWETGSTWKDGHAIAVLPPMASWSHLALSEGGDLVALGRRFEAGSEVFVVALPSRKLMAVGFSSSRITALSFSASDLFNRGNLIVGDDSGAIRVWPCGNLLSLGGKPPTPTNIENLDLLGKYSASVTTLWVDARKRLGAGYRDGMVRIWDLEGQREVTRLIGYEPVLSVALSDQVAISAGRDLRAKAWSLAELVPLGFVTNAEFSPYSSLLLIGAISTPPRLWDVTQRRVLNEWTGISGLPMAINPSATLAAFFDTDSLTLSVRRFSAGKEGETLWSQRVKFDDVRASPIFSSDGKFIATATGAGVFIWNATTGEEESRLPVALESHAVFTLTPDSRQILIAARGGGISLVSIHGGKLSRLPYVPDVKIASVAMSPDGKALAVAEDTGLASSDDVSTSTKMHVYSYPSGRELSAFQQPGLIDRITFSPDSRYFLSASHQGAVVLWDAREAKQGFQFSVPDALQAVGFTRDGKIVIVSSTQMTFYSWKVPDLLREACRRVDHNLNPKEWHLRMPEEPYIKVCPNLP